MTMIKINSKKLHEALDAYNAEHGTNTSELARQMGRADSYLHTIMTRGTMPSNAMKMISLLFGIKPEDYVWTHEDEEPEEPETTGWDFQFEVLPEKGCVKAWIVQGGETLVHGFARIKLPQTNTTIAQAVSYAAHVCYKKVEQLELEAL